MVPLETDKFSHPLGRFGAVPLTRAALDEVLQSYRRPNDKVSEWLREGALQHLRRGLYLAGPGLRKASACLPLVANHLYGPSTVSLDFALAWHGLIPEGVAEITSVTPKDSRSYANSLGRFTYKHLPLAYYTIGQSLGENTEGLGFVIASPTKALCDRLVLSRELPLFSRMAMRQWLLEDLRIDPDCLATLSLAEIGLCMEKGFKQRQLGTLRAVIKSMEPEDSA